MARTTAAFVSDEKKRLGRFGTLPGTGAGAEAGTEVDEVDAIEAAKRDAPATASTTARIGTGLEARLLAAGQTRLRRTTDSRRPSGLCACRPNFTPTSEGLSALCSESRHQIIHESQVTRLGAPFPFEVFIKQESAVAYERETPPPQALRDHRWVTEGRDSNEGVRDTPVDARREGDGPRVLMDYCGPRLARTQRDALDGKTKA
jgi:hypothetical protein